MNAPTGLHVMILPSGARTPVSPASSFHRYEALYGQRYKWADATPEEAQAYHAENYTMKADDLAASFQQDAAESSRMAREYLLNDERFTGVSKAARNAWATNCQTESADLYLYARSLAGAE